MNSKSLVVVLVVALIACGSPAGLCGCEPVPPYTTQIVGFVHDSAGAPTAARVRVFFRDLQCQGPSFALRWETESGVAADTAGHYRLPVSTPSSDTLCVRLVARSSIDSAARDSLRVAVRFQDSLRVDFTVR